jgi:hypothetical protein
MSEPVLGKLLVIPDAHAHPEYDNDRFTWLGRFVMDTRPDVIVCLGDWADMPSLSSYDKGTRGFEGRRYRKDIDAAVDAQAKFFAPMVAHNKRKAELKEKQYRPRMVMTLGNHEDRINRVTNASPELHGAIGIEDLKFAEFGWEVYPYQIPFHYLGISFCHAFATGISGRPISGVNHARALITKLHSSAVVGHSHLVDWAEGARVDGTKIFGLVAGCYSHPDQVEGWNLATEHLWWRGVVEIRDLDGEGYYDSIQHITMRKIKRDYA